MTSYLFDKSFLWDKFDNLVRLIILTNANCTVIYTKQNFGEISVVLNRISPKADVNSGIKNYLFLINLTLTSPKKSFWNLES